MRLPRCVLLGGLTVLALLQAHGADVATDNASEVIKAARTSLRGSSAETGAAILKKEYQEVIEKLQDDKDVEKLPKLDLKTPLQHPDKGKKGMMNVKKNNKRTLPMPKTKAIKYPISAIERPGKKGLKVLGRGEARKFKALKTGRRQLGWHKHDKYYNYYPLDYAHGYDHGRDYYYDYYQPYHYTRKHKGHKHHGHGYVYHHHRRYNKKRNHKKTRGYHTVHGYHKKEYVHRDL